MNFLVGQKIRLRDDDSLRKICRLNPETTWIRECKGKIFTISNVYGTSIHIKESVYSFNSFWIEPFIVEKVKVSDMLC